MAGFEPALLPYPIGGRDVRSNHSSAFSPERHIDEPWQDEPEGFFNQEEPLLTLTSQSNLAIFKEQSVLKY
jgi:hypothetical protein